MPYTDYHAQYFAHELTKRCASDSVEKLAGAVAGTQVDLNPHQLDAALFAFRSPLSRGALFADEVGLGKTIEGGLVLAQRDVPFRGPRLLRMGQGRRQPENREPAAVAAAGGAAGTRSLMRSSAWSAEPSQ